MLTEILNLKIPKNFGWQDYYEKTESIDEVIQQIKDCKNYHYTWGATKFVIIGKNNVIKIPFNGFFKNNEFYYFDYDYCEREISLYQKMIEKKIEYFFIETKFADLSNISRPIYYAEKVNLFSERFEEMKEKPLVKQVLKKYKKEVFDLVEFYNIRFSREWIKLALAYYGEDKVSSLFDFLREECITDLHTDNIGFKEDGSPIILDYAGFYESSSIHDSRESDNYYFS